MFSWNIEAEVPETVVVLRRGKFVLIRYQGRKYYEVLPNRNTVGALKNLVRSLK